MCPLPAAASRSLMLFTPPYERLVPCPADLITRPAHVDEWKGCAVVWQLASDAAEATIPAAFPLSPTACTAPGAPWVATSRPPACRCPRTASTSRDCST